MIIMAFKVYSFALGRDQRNLSIEKGIQKNYEVSNLPGLNITNKYLLNTPSSQVNHSHFDWNVHNVWLKNIVNIDKRLLSEVGFEPTPSFEDQNAHFIEAKNIILESGALDRSAILTLIGKLPMFTKLLIFDSSDMESKS